MQKLCCVRTRQHPLPVWSHNLSLTNLLISPSILNHFRWELYQVGWSLIKHPLQPDDVTCFACSAGFRIVDSVAVSRMIVGISDEHTVCSFLSFNLGDVLVLILTVLASPHVHRCFANIGFCPTKCL